MIDIHSHMLFGIDDGTRGIDMSIQMLRLACDQGVTDVFCTSHSHGLLDKYHKNLLKLKERVIQENIPITLHTGCEIYCSKYSVAEVVAGIQNGQYPSLADSTHILIEFDPYENADNIEYCVRCIQAHVPSSKIVIAHIERCKKLKDAQQTIKTLLELGCYFQINAYSLQEETNEVTKQFARQLLIDGHVAFIGSDAHRPDHRPPAVAKGVEYIYSHCDKEYADAVCFKNAEILLIGHNSSND